MNEGQTQMEKAVDHLRSEFSKLRVGRASTTMVEEVHIEAYGSKMTMKEVAAISTPDARTIAIQPWDKSVINDIEKGILAANLGLTPINDGSIIRITLPPLTEDRRKDFVKQIKKYGEEAKIATRNIRRQINDDLKTSKEAGDLTEDDLKREQESAQKLTDKYVEEIDRLVTAKSEEVMSI